MWLVLIDLWYFLTFQYNTDAENHAENCKENGGENSPPGVRSASPPLSCCLAFGVFFFPLPDLLIQIVIEDLHKLFELV